MKVKSLMIPDPITIKEDTPIQEAIELMKTNTIRHLPVISKKNILKGFVTQADLKLGFLPSVVGNVSLSDVMIKNPIMVAPEDDIEVASQLIYKHKIGGMPVVENGRLVGIITQTDILRTFIEMMGILNSSSRIDVEIENKPELFNRAFQIIQKNGGDIINVGMTGKQTGKRIYFFRLSPCKTKIIKSALENEGFEVLASMD